MREKERENKEREKKKRERKKREKREKERRKREKRKRREKRKKRKMSPRCTRDVIGRNAQNYRYIGRNAQNLKKLVSEIFSYIFPISHLSHLLAPKNSERRYDPAIS